MDTIFTVKQQLRNSKTELFGGELVRPFEGPSRAQYIIDRVCAVDLGAVHAPDDFGMDPILAMHDAGLVGFLQVAWDDWLAEGFKGEALADALGKVAGYGPDGLIISLGMDRFETDPISFFKLTRDDFTTDGADIAATNLGEWLAIHAPKGLNHVYYTCGGSTVNDAAVRLVHFYNTIRGKHRKKMIISRNDAYHGATYVAAELTGIHATKTSFDRIGQDFIRHVFDYTPDILVSAKGITSGYIPLSTTLIFDEIYDVISRPQCEGGVFSMGLTYFGHPVACATALKNVEIIEREGLLGNAHAVGAYMQASGQGLRDLPMVGDMRGHGGMMAVDLVADKTTRAGLARQMGLTARCLPNASARA